MSKLRYYTSQAVEELRRGVPNHLDWYYNHSGSPPPLTPIAGIRESRIELPDLSPLRVGESETPHLTDAKNALIVYTSLRELTPHQASIERMWVYLCHNVALNYVRDRWLGLQRTQIEDKAIKKVHNHFFAKGIRSLIRDNGLSRLWWLGKIAHDVDPDDPRRFLDILFYRQDVRSALIERPSVSMNRRVLRAIYCIMQESWDADKLLFKRDIFRSWMIALNRRGGVVLLDSLSEKNLDKLLRREAEGALGA